MLLSVNQLIGYAIQTEAGTVGKLSDVLFDDVSSHVRYHVIQAGDWLSDRRVLLPPAVLGELQPENRMILTALTKDQVRESPPIDTDKPVSRQQEEALHGHYGWTPYWESPVARGDASPNWRAFPVWPRSDVNNLPKGEAAEAQHGDPHLRSAREVLGYYINAKDGDIGHVEDLLIVEQDWIIQYLVINTRNWRPGKKVLVVTDRLESVDWHSQRIAVDLEREQIKSSPEYDQAMVMDKTYEERLYRRYGRDAGAT